MWLQLAAGAILLGNYIYHRLTAEDPPSPKDALSAPKSEEGGTVPLIFGRCRIRRPAVAWQGGQEVNANGLSPTGYIYEARILYVLGVPFYEGTTKLTGAYIGDDVAGGVFPRSPSLGTLLQFQSSGLSIDDPDFFDSVDGDFGDGSIAQDFDNSYGATWLQSYALASATEVPGFRGYATVAVHAYKPTAQLPEISFELSTYASTPEPWNIGPFYFLTNSIGLEANPASVISAILCDQFGKLGRTPSQIIDITSFGVAAQALSAEGHGYSRAFEESTSAQDMINEVLRQIDAVLYEEPTTGLFVLKLVRADYDISALPLINATNNTSMTNYTAGGWTSLTNKIRVVFENRDRSYREGSATAQNLANAVGQDGVVREEVIEFPGCKTYDLAQKLAARELAARSRPIAKCRVAVDRLFWNTRPGDVVRLTWPNYGVSEMVMRVAAVSRGGATENVVYLDLIQDYFYTHRRVVSPIGSFTAFPSGGLGIG